ncbi:transketolase-like protein 1 isoform X2 [Fukomys damarensis]|uniref:transketolase-like protein 1 isoform X2 n=1 Tax=Fukomys damarensis TaxID=885580 RepID=UPI0005400B2E|nr:transketolase-like protein 1 isoform X2 [Fukomys damarensis]
MIVYNVKFACDKYPNPTDLQAQRKSHHPTSCSSSAEIMSVLFFYTMRYKQWDLENPNNDRFILSKRLSFVDVATGWLGQGLGVCCGMAYTGKYFDRASYRVFCLLGEGEASEGSVWEALAFASYYSLDNLVAIFDVNRLGHGSSFPLEHYIEIYQKRCKAFGWNTYVVDGRDVEALCHVFWQAAHVKGKPTAVVAKTFKGRGMPNSAEDAESWHGKPMPQGQADAIITLIGSQIQTNRSLTPKHPIEDSPQVNIENIKMTTLPAYEVGDMMATRKACGMALAKLGYANDRVVVLDSDTKSFTFSNIFKKEHPERFIECFVAEQNMVSVALGCAMRGRTVAFASTFAAYLSRAYDQIRVGAICGINICLIGSHCGVSVGEDGPTQMALEDLAMFRALPNCTIFYPSDAVSTEYAVFLAANAKGLCYIRTSQQETEVLYGPQEIFKIGQAKCTREGSAGNVHLAPEGPGCCRVKALYSGQLCLGCEWLLMATLLKGVVECSPPCEVQVLCALCPCLNPKLHLGGDHLSHSCMVIRYSDKDKVTVIGAGVTVHEALMAADELCRQDISIRIIDLFTIKPLDAATIICNAKATGGRIITVEDHYMEGGLGEAVCAAVSSEPDIVVHQLAAPVMVAPRCGHPSEMLSMFGISSRQISEAVKHMLAQ